MSNNRDYLGGSYISGKIYTYIRSTYYGKSSTNAPMLKAYAYARWDDEPYFKYNDCIVLTSNGEAHENVVNGSFDLNGIRGVFSKNIDCVNYKRSIYKPYDTYYHNTISKTVKWNIIKTILYNKIAFSEGHLQRDTITNITSFFAPLSKNPTCGQGEISGFTILHNPVYSKPTLYVESNHIPWMSGKNVIFIGKYYHTKKFLTIMKTLVFQLGLKEVQEEEITVVRFLKI